MNKEHCIPHPSRTDFCGLLLLAATGWAAVDSLRTWPNYLAYFNQLAGGPRNGYKHLVDSSLDWGQDLPGLKKWLDANDPVIDDGRKEAQRKRPVYVSYFGTGDLSAYRIDHVQRLPGSFPGGMLPDQVL